MKIIRNFAQIGSVGNFIQKSSEGLRQEKTVIQKNINEILINYEGKDANEIVNKIIEATNEIDIISEQFESYGIYMQKFAEYDRDNLQKTISSLNQINADIITPNTYDKILDTKINMNNFNSSVDDLSSTISIKDYDGLIGGKNE